MNERYKCYTLVDITQTNVTRRSADSDALLRNQQRNWETLLQCISLRAQPLNVSTPIVQHNVTIDSMFGTAYYSETHSVWMFGFATEHANVFLDTGDPVELLHSDVEHAPVIVNLTESAKIDPMFIVSGSKKNIFFVLD